MVAGSAFRRAKTLFSPHFSARPGRFLPGFCVDSQKTASLGFLRQFGSALGAVSLEFLRKIQRVTVFLAIITQITAKNHPVGAAALSGPCSFCKRKFDFFDKLGPAGLGGCPYNS